jgi:hypothetical protein
MQAGGIMLLDDEEMAVLARRVNTLWLGGAREIALGIVGGKDRREPWLTPSCGGRQVCRRVFWGFRARVSPAPPIFQSCHQIDDIAAPASVFDILQNALAVARLALLLDQAVQRIDVAVMEFLGLEGAVFFSISVVASSIRSSARLGYL